MHKNARITQHFGADALRLLCVPGGRHQYHWRRRPIANNRKTCTINMGVAGCNPTVGAKRVENDVKAIQKRVPFTSKCSQKRWRLGLRPRPSNSEGESFRPLPVWHAELKMVLRLFKNGFHLHPNNKGERPKPSTLASLTRKIENGVNAITLFKNGLHSLPIAPKSQKRWWLRLRPRPPQ